MVTHLGISKTLHLDGKQRPQLIQASSLAEHIRAPRTDGFAGWISRMEMLQAGPLDISDIRRPLAV